VKLDEGGQIFMKMEETFFASRFAQLRDRFGTSWMLLHERRPVVLANLVLYFVGALSLLRALGEPGVPRALWGLAVPLALLAVVYGVLLLRGPLDPLARGAPSTSR
jgi:hypothetical protein